MHTLTKVLINLNLVLCLVLSQYVWISLSGNVQWRERYESERDARHRDKSKLEDAYSELAGVRESNRNARGQGEAEIAGLNATLQTLQAVEIEAKAAALDAKATADGLLQSAEPFGTISLNYANDVVRRLQDAVEQRAEQKSQEFDRRGRQLAALAMAHNTYAERHEQYRQLEYQQYLMQEELESRLETKARFRSLRPDIQSEIGDSGPVVFASVAWVTGNSVGLNKGRRDGVEERQKYTITRNGRTVAVVDVVEVQNETCECVVIDMVDRNVAPRAGDDAVTKLFMSRLSAGRD